MCLAYGEMTAPCYVAAFADIIKRGLNNLLACCISCLVIHTVLEITVYMLLLLAHCQVQRAFLKSFGILKRQNEIGVGLLRGSRQPFQALPQQEEFKYLTLEVPVSVSLRQSDY